MIESIPPKYDCEIFNDNSIINQKENEKIYKE
jgi:hypothetical protein